MTKITTTGTQASTPEYKLKLNGLIFVVAMWLLSRLLIVVAMQIITPLVITAEPPYLVDSDTNFKPSWDLFSHWDGNWYLKIATEGYDYANDGKQHSIAFFPLFPLAIRALITLGLPSEVAATLVNNLAFLGAMLLVYYWTQKRHGLSAARWATAVLAWCPLSLYGTVIYTEGLFLLLTTAALQAFDNHQHIRAALFGALATATRATGITLVPAFLLVAWKERRPVIAYGAGLFAGVGLLSFILYCAIRFQDPLAFVHAQKGWAQPSWLMLIRNALTLHKTSLVIFVMVFGGSYLLWHLRDKLSSVAIVYGFCSLLLIISNPVLLSVHRFAYGIVSLSLAFGVLLSSHKRWGYAVMGLFGVWLLYYAISFARWNWVA